MKALSQNMTSTVTISEEVSEHETRKINWRDTLSTVLGKAPARVEFDRAWSHFCQDMRTLCPETQWYSIHSPSGDYNEDSAKVVQSMHNWLKFVVANSEWPFPETVLLINKSNEFSEFIVAMNKRVEKLPFVSSPESLTIVPWRDKHFNGWRITINQSISINKTGEA